MQSRRTALITLATASASAAMTPLLQQEQHQHGVEETSVPSPQEPSYFSPPDYAIVSRVVDLIVPRTDTPGALDAGVPFRIDRQVGLTPKLQADFKEGLAFLSTGSQKAHRAAFVDLSEAQQIALLKGMGEFNPFFQTIKNLTIEWYYRTEQGLVQELGFKGNTFRASFPGCTHPGHWPNQEKS